MNDNFIRDGWNRYSEKAAMRHLLAAAEAITYGQLDEAARRTQKAQQHLGRILDEAEAAQ